MVKNKSARHQIVPFLLLSFFIVLVSTPLATSGKSRKEAYVYSLPELSSTVLNYFDNKPDWEVANYDLHNSTYSYEFLQIVTMLAGRGVEVVPQGVCTPCELKHFTWEEIYVAYSSPLIVFFRDGRLTDITIAITNHKVLDQVLMNAGNGVKVVAREKTYTLSDEDIRTRLEGVITRQQAKANDYTNVLKVLPLIVTAAAVDAINPCEFYVLIVFLSLIFHRIGRKAVLNAGIAYSIAIFTIYFLMGFGLLQLISYVQEARLLVVILGLSVGFRAVLNFVFGVFGLSIGLRDTIWTFLNKKFKRVPEFFSKRLSVYLTRVSEKPITAFAVGVLASAFLLPCTSGPYLIALSLLANLETLLEGLLLLAVYNGIIIAPFLAITLGIYMLKLKTSELKKWSSRRQKWLNLMAGLLMIFLSLYLLSTIVL